MNCSKKEDLIMEKTKEFAKQWIEEGKPCVYRYGYGWKGAGAHTITKEKVLNMLSSYSFSLYNRNPNWLKNFN